MNTPAHVAASVLVWRNRPGWGAATAVTIGALLPDLPMFAFYAYQRHIVHRSEADIWSKLYFADSWQTFFDLFNSIPLLMAVAAASHLCRFRWGVLLACSALLHVVCDLPLHHDDAHRHFLPLSSWRFVSPVSYWDPAHHGLVFVWLELAFTLAACTYVGWWGSQRPMRIVARLTLAFYIAGLIFAAIVWLPLGGNKETRGREDNGTMGPWSLRSGDVGLATCARQVATSHQPLALLTLHSPLFTPHSSPAPSH